MPGHIRADGRGQRRSGFLRRLHTGAHGSRRSLALRAISHHTSEIGKYFRFGAFREEEVREL